ncbi:MAG: hypothetical protein NW224_30565 [Leptolyngbyaceae cyanobacterium bins.302]|nr:hypothetical protein [Leptolyngbyaceae cyanobacterium bins.302]
MKGRFLLGFLGIFLLLAGCSGNSENTGSQLASEQAPIGAANPQAFDTPLVSQSRKAGTLSPVPGLLQPTNAKARANAIVTGRRDPFAAIPGSAPTIVVSANRPTAKVNVAPLPTGSAASNKLPAIPLPPLATAPLPNLSNSPLPPLGVPAAPIVPPSRTALAESIQVSGVVQVSGKWSVIVKEPSASSSRHVAVGEYLENGKVLVKKVVSPNSTDPIVVLQQDGVEIRKSLV